MEALTLELSVINALKADQTFTSLVCDRVMPLVPDADTAYPCVIYQSSRPRQARDLDNALSDIGEMLMTFTVVSERYADAKRLVSTMRSIFEECCGSRYDTHQISHIDVEESDESADPNLELCWFELTATVIFKEL